VTTGCCTSCRGTGVGGPASDPETNGRCADCLATGHDHPADTPCATGDQSVRIVADVIGRTTRDHRTTQVRGNPMSKVDEHGWPEAPGVGFMKRAARVVENVIVREELPYWVPSSTPSWAITTRSGTGSAVVEALLRAGWMPPLDGADLPDVEGSTLPRLIAAYDLDQAAAALAQYAATAARLAILGDSPRDVRYWAAAHAAVRLADLSGEGDASPSKGVVLPVSGC
jgi:hypothetical protein